MVTKFDGLFGYIILVLHTEHLSEDYDSLM
jgi:hypothetical protein